MLRFMGSESRHTSLLPDLRGNGFSFSSLSIIWCITLTDLHILKKSLHLWDASLLIYCGIWIASIC